MFDLQYNNATLAEEGVRKCNYEFVNADATWNTNYENLKHLSSKRATFQCILKVFFRELLGLEW